jgi:hypothetical protein
VRHNRGWRGRDGGGVWQAGTDVVAEAMVVGDDLSQDGIEGVDLVVQFSHNGGYVAQILRRQGCGGLAGKHVGGVGGRGWRRRKRVGGLGEPRVEDQRL